jgi:hypothetical protein
MASPAATAASAAVADHFDDGEECFWVCTCGLKVA